jgi:hypothetical protein
MTFFLREGWNVSSLEADAKTPLARSFTFKDSDKIGELARRGERSELRKRNNYLITRSNRAGEGSTCPYP